MSSKYCTVETCELKVKGHGLCNKHYQRFKNTGTTDLKPRVHPVRYCSIDGCERKHNCKGLCRKHYSRLRLTGTTDNPYPDICTVDGCSGKHKAKGYCIKHYNRVQFNGSTYRDPRAGRGQAIAFLHSLIGTSIHSCIEWPFSINAHGYGRICVNKKNTSAHRHMLILIHGDPGDNVNLYACHNCGNRSCVNPNHLRFATPSENQLDRWEHGTMANQMGKLTR